MLLWSGDRLVDHAGHLARSLRVPPVLVGAVVLALEMFRGARFEADATSRVDDGSRKHIEFDLDTLSQDSADSEHSH